MAREIGSWEGMQALTWPEFRLLAYQAQYSTQMKDLNERLRDVHNMSMADAEWKGKQVRLLQNEISKLQARFYWEVEG